MTFRVKVLLAVLAFAFFKIHAQSTDEKGFPFVTNYTHTDFHASSANLGVVRDSQGLFYAANQDGVLVYDGYQWELIPIEKNKPVYWVEIGADGVIYVASSSEFGYLSSKNGCLKYTSLLDKVDAQYHDFEVVWEIAKTTKSVVFRSKKYLFVKSGDKIEVIKTKTGFDVAFTTNDTVYTRESRKGFTSSYHCLQ